MKKWDYKPIARRFASFVAGRKVGPDLANVADAAVGSVADAEESKPRKWMFWRRRPKQVQKLLKIFYNKDPKITSGEADKLMKDALVNLQHSAKTILSAIEGQQKYHPSMYIHLLQELKNARIIMKQFGPQMKETDLYYKLDHDIAFTTIALKRLRTKLREQGLDKMQKFMFANEKQDGDKETMVRLITKAHSFLDEFNSYKAKGIKIGRSKAKALWDKAGDIAVEMRKFLEKYPDVVDLVRNYPQESKIMKEATGKLYEAFGELERMWQSGENFFEMGKISKADRNTFYRELANTLKQLKIKIALSYQGSPSGSSARKSAHEASSMISQVSGIMAEAMANPEENPVYDELIRTSILVLPSIEKFRKDFENGRWVFSDNEGVHKLNKIAMQFFKPAGKLASKVLQRPFGQAAKTAGKMVRSAGSRLMRGQFGRAARRLDVGAAHLARSTRAGAIAHRAGASKSVRRKMHRFVKPAIAFGGQAAAFGVADRITGGGDNEGANKSIKCKDLYKGLVLMEKQLKKIYGGKARSKNITEEKVDPQQLRMGIEVEMEHTDNKHKAKQIALDHLAEISDYYTRLKRMEDEAPKRK